MDISNELLDFYCKTSIKYGTRDVVLFYRPAANPPLIGRRRDWLMCHSKIPKSSRLMEKIKDDPRMHVKRGTPHAFWLASFPKEGPDSITAIPITEAS